MPRSRALGSVSRRVPASRTRGRNAVPKALGALALLTLYVLITAVLAPIPILIAWAAIAGVGMPAQFQPDGTIHLTVSAVWFALVMLGALSTGVAVLRRWRNPRRCAVVVVIALAAWAALTCSASLVLLAVY